MYKINDEKIDKYINELGEEYKELLFEMLIKKSYSLNDLSVSELIRIDSDVKNYMQTQKDNKKNRKLLVIGVTYIFLGVFMYLFSDILLKFYDLRYLSSIELIQIMSITVSLMGVLASFYSFMKGTKREETFHESQNKKLLEYEIISTWRELEGVTNDIAISNNLVENKSVIRFLENENLISEDEKSLLTKFLKLRNSVVHGDQIKLSLQEMRDEIKMVAVLIEKINSRLLPKNK